MEESGDLKEVMKEHYELKKFINKKQIHKRTFPVISTRCHRLYVMRHSNVRRNWNSLTECNVSSYFLLFAGASSASDIFLFLI